MRQDAVCRMRGPTRTLAANGKVAAAGGAAACEAPAVFLGELDAIRPMPPRTRRPRA